MKATKSDFKMRKQQYEEEKLLLNVARDLGGVFVKFHRGTESSLSSQNYIEMIFFASKDFSDTDVAIKREERCCLGRGQSTSQSPLQQQSPFSYQHSEDLCFLFTASKHSDTNGTAILMTSVCFHLGRHMDAGNAHGCELSIFLSHRADVVGREVEGLRTDFYKHGTLLCQDQCNIVPMNHQSPKQ
ncbi:uncharacterized protein V6R79_022970 [Siganus canaliculatus]